MTNNSSVERFLQLEEQANQLVDVLATLERETANYSTASGQLGDASGNLREVTVALREVTAGLTELIESANQVGTPAILDKQVELTGKLAELETHIARNSAVNTRQLQKIKQFNVLVLIVVLASVALSIVGIVLK